MPNLTPEDMVDEMRRNTRALEDMARELRLLREAVEPPLRSLGEKLGALGGVTGLLKMFGGGHRG